jgi:hypothetical protein
MPESHQAFKLALRERTGTPVQRHPDYDLILNGKVVGEVYYNMTGYVGMLPQADGTGFTPGETGISAYRAEIARINREARKSSISSWKGDQTNAALSRS